MRKFIVTVTAVLFVFSAASLLAGSNCGDHGKDGHMKMEGKERCLDGKGGACVMNLDADYSVTETKDGAVITIKAKKGGAAVKDIQEKAKKCVEMCAAKKDDKAAAAAGDEEVVCPVMGVKMKKSKAFESIEYEGKTYYFCCAGCKGTFLKNPEKYIKK